MIDQKYLHIRDQRVKIQNTLHIFVFLSQLLKKIVFSGTLLALKTLYRALYEINYIYFFQHRNLILDIRMIKIK